ncbi:MAG: flagellar biosynthesis protein FlhF [Burkholderiales bacterium]|nr:flagellar biosynthesis protein FlhF [Burkholderiales bacterium]
MNIQRFTAPTSREALAKARLAFGDGTLILSNRPTDNGVEVVATAEDALSSLTQKSDSNGQKPSHHASRGLPPSHAELSSKVEDDATELSMSTLSFQDYVRERMMRRRSESGASQSGTPTPINDTPVRPRMAAPERPIEAAAVFSPAATVPARKHAPASPPIEVNQGIAQELHAMKELIEDRFNTLSWLGQARQNPIQANMMLKLIRAGYSPTLARTILERMPAEMDAAESVRWVLDVLQRNLKTDEGGVPLHSEGGVFALIGATGVGKTTTTAKLAGLCARAHGAGSVGLITLDSYRIGAHEQLRAYGKMLGVVAHLAHDYAALKDLLGLLSSKKMVLIDTTGLAPRDPRKREMMELLDIPNVKRLLVLNASGHGDTLDDVVSAFKQPTGQQAILSKIDEAVKLGPAIDAAVRHQLILRGVTTGQRVPEDWEAAVSTKLVAMSMRSPGNSPYDPIASDLGFFFNQSNKSAYVKGHLDA